MTTEDYLRMLKKLKLTPSGKATAEALGLSLRHCQRIAAGKAIVPEPIAKLLACLIAARSRALRR